MYNLASKILSLFLDPLALAIILLVCAFLVRKRRPKVFRITFVVMVMFLAVAACPTMEVWLTASLERQYPDRDVDSYPSAQAIVVLGGTIHMPSGVHHASAIIDSSDRLLMALRLYHAGKAPRVVLSGGNNPVFTEKVPEQSEAEVMRSLLEEWGIPDSAIQVEGGSINTHENALFSYRLLAGHGVRRIILVTSAMHMPRAAAAFRRAAFDVVAAPADFQSGWGEPGPIFRWIPDAGALIGSSRAIHEWLGLWVYRIRGGGIVLRGTKSGKPSPHNLTSWPWCGLQRLTQSGPLLYGNDQLFNVFDPRDCPLGCRTPFLRSGNVVRVRLWNYRLVRISLLVRF